MYLNSEKENSFELLTQEDTNRLILIQVQMGVLLLENTDENHDITLQQIIEKLALYNVTAERKSLYDDIAQLNDFGIKIKKTQYGKTFHYQLINRDFEIAELKLLVDSVASAKFITEKNPTS